MASSHTTGLGLKLTLALGLLVIGITITNLTGRALTATKAASNTHGTNIAAASLNKR